jgi:ABC-2 type transport system permease protein
MLQRIGAMVFKELRQMLRDPGTLAMMIMMPLVQLTIFGFAINGDPRHLPLAVESNDNSAFSRSIVTALRNTSYFDVNQTAGSYGQGERLIASGEAQFVLTIPPDFARALVRGERPQLLLTVDATDPASTGPAVAAVGRAVSSALDRELIGPLAVRRPGREPVDLVIHTSYNPEGITSHNTVPGLLAIILSMTLVLQTAMSVTREGELGTMENLLATPLRPIEVMIGKIVPNLLIGTVQTCCSWWCAWRWASPSRPSPAVRSRRCR